MQKLATVVVLGMLLTSLTPPAEAQVFCNRERGVGTLQEDPELQHLLHAWINTIGYTAMYDACGLRNGRVIRHLLAERLGRCPASERQAIVERCVLYLLFDRADSYPGTCADATSRSGRSEESVRAEAALGPEEFFRDLDADPKSLTRTCL